jgi:hypothetical protein
MEFNCKFFELIHSLSRLHLMFSQILGNRTMHFSSQNMKDLEQLNHKKWKQNLSETFRFVSLWASQVGRLSLFLGMLLLSAQPAYAEGSISLKQANKVYVNYITALLKINNNRSFNALLYVFIPDSHQYLKGTSGFNPLRFVFFTNHKNFKNANSSHSRDLSHDFVETNLGNSSASASFQNPSSTDAFMSFSNKVFLTRKDSLSGSLTRKIQGISTQTSAYQGGNFSFNAPSTAPFQIILDLDNDGIFGNGNDRILTGTATVGTNTIFWDGRDGTASKNSHN